MASLTAVKIQITVFDDPAAEACYNSYTLINTPFYFKPIWYDSDLKTNYSQYRIFWEFGDGTTTTGPSATHFYKYPGVYNIKATLYDATGNTLQVLSSTNSGPLQVTVKNAFPDKLIFYPFVNIEQGTYMLPAGQYSIPLRIERYNSWQNNDALAKNDYSIMLYASGCRSDYLSVSSYYTDKWSHLRSYFGFVEREVTSNNKINSRLVDSTKTTSTSVYATKSKKTGSWEVDLNFFPTKTKDSIFIGTSGTAIMSSKTVHFIDQRPSSLKNTDLIFVFASFDTRAFADYYNVTSNSYDTVLLPAYGYINFKPEIQHLKSTFNPAKSLAITSNGITAEGTTQTIGPVTAEYIHSFNINPIKWVGADIPFVITFKDSLNYTTKCYPPVTGINESALTQKQVYVNLCGVTELSSSTHTPVLSTFRIPEARFSINPRAPKYTESGSYFCGIVNIPVACNSVFLSAYTIIKDDVQYKGGFGYGYAGQPGLRNITRFKKRSVYSNCNVPELTFALTGDTTTYNVSPSATVAISVAPLNTYSGNATYDKVWVADADEDRIFVYNSSGTNLATLPLSAIYVQVDINAAPQLQDLRGTIGSASPANIAIDSKGYAWVSLYDAVNCIKIHPETYVVVASAVPPFTSVPFLSASEYNALSGFVGENTILPSALDTDTKDNVWVAYSHPLSGFLIKYNQHGNILAIIGFDPLLSIQEILVDRNDNVWVGAVNYNTEQTLPFVRTDKLYKFDANGNLIANFPKNITNFSNITIDLNQNIYVGNNYSKVNIYNADGTTKIVNVGTQSQISHNISPVGGVAVDTDGYLWAIQNVDGVIYFYDVSQRSLTSDTPVSTVKLPNIQRILPDGFQAFYSVLGDWTGIRWVNKYVTAVETAERIISGKSNLFRVHEQGPIINKKNENFDQAATLKSYILQESFFDKRQLLDQFLGQIVGNFQSSPETLGKAIYEKIANFVDNTADPDVCNLQALKSLFAQYGLDFNYFVASYPPKLKRAVDILSINKSRLFGSPNLFNYNFGLSAYGFNLGKNLGSQISIDSGMFTVGKPIVAYEKFSEKYTLLTNTIVPSAEGMPVPVVGQQYPLSALTYDWGWNLVTANKSQSGVAIDPYYIFYEYQPHTPNNMVDGIIDFTNETTTISPTNSSYNDWTKYGGTMDLVLSRAFYEGLEILK